MGPTPRPQWSNGVVKTSSTEMRTQPLLLPQGSQASVETVGMQVAHLGSFVRLDLEQKMIFFKRLFSV